MGVGGLGEVVDDEEEEEEEEEVDDDDDDSTCSLRFCWGMEDETETMGKIKPKSSFKLDMFATGWRRFGDESSGKEGREREAEEEEDDDDDEVDEEERASVIRGGEEEVVVVGREGEGLGRRGWEYGNGDVVVCVDEMWRWRGVESVSLCAVL